MFKINANPMLLAAVSGVMLIACADNKAVMDPKSPKQDTSHLTAPPRDSPEAPEEESTRGSIQVDPEIARVCDLPTAYFEFDSAKIRGTAAQALDALATCFTRGALENREMRIIGHADPRGPVDYNFALGQRRAGSVANYLTTQGVDPNKVATTSMGELEATGRDEASWSRDRRVEILLADHTSADPSRQPSARLENPDR